MKFFFTCLHPPPPGDNSHFTLHSVACICAYHAVSLYCVRKLLLNQGPPSSLTPAYPTPVTPGPKLRLNCRSSFFRCMMYRYCRIRNSRSCFAYIMSYPSSNNFFSSSSLQAYSKTSSSKSTPPRFTCQSIVHVTSACISSAIFAQSTPDALLLLFSR